MATLRDFTQSADWVFFLHATPSGLVYWTSRVLGRAAPNKAGVTLPNYHTGAHRCDRMSRPRLGQSFPLSKEKPHTLPWSRGAAWIKTSMQLGGPCWPMHTPTAVGGKISSGCKQGYFFYTYTKTPSGFFYWQFTGHSFVTRGSKSEQY